MGLGVMGINPFAVAEMPISFVSGSETETGIELHWGGNMTDENDRYEYDYNGTFWTGKIILQHQGEEPDNWSVSLNFKHIKAPHSEDWATSEELAASDILYENIGVTEVSVPVSGLHSDTGHYDVGELIISRDSTTGEAKVGVYIEHINLVSSP